MKDKVSIIIPVYNAESYIRDSVSSVLSQDYSLLEIILVDDGSTDNSSQICDELSERNSNIKVFHQENTGAGTARNKGIKSCDGEYVFFLDADDLLDGNHVISRLVAKAKETNADIVCGSFRKITENGISEVNHHHFSDDDNQNTVDFRFKGYFQYGHLGFNWGKLYRKSFWEKNNLSSPTYPYIEDKAFSMRTSAYEPKYAFVEESVYQYRLSNQSVAFSDKHDFVQVWTQVAKDFSIFLQERHIEKDFQDLIAFHMFLGIYSLANQKLHHPDSGFYDLRNALKEYGTDEFTQGYLKMLSKGKYVNEINAKGWKYAIRISSTVYSWKWYGVLAFAMTVIHKCNIDKKVIALKYKGKE